MHASYQEMLETPMHVIYKDLEHISTENQVKRQISERSNGPNR